MMKARILAKPRRIPDWLYRRLERLYLNERASRQRESQQKLAEQDRRIRYYYSWARFMHAHKQCMPDCPYKGCAQ